MESNEQERKIIEAAALLPDKERRAFWWAVENFDELRRYCENSYLTPEELGKYYAYARKREDAALVALLALYECIHRNDGEAKGEKESKEGDGNKG